MQVSVIALLDECFCVHGYYIQFLKKDLGVEDQFKVLGFISRKDQIQLIRKSIAVIQPSLFEGWSTVVEDARSLGKSIFLSDFPVHVEQDPPNAYFFQQQNAEQLADLIYLNISKLTSLSMPDFKEEQKALKENKDLMKAFARRIIEMAKMVN